jgi:hypothetical protein
VDLAEADRRGGGGGGGRPVRDGEHRRQEKGVANPSIHGLRNSSNWRGGWTPRLRWWPGERQDCSA